MLTNSEMCVDTGITSRAGQVFVLPVRDMEVGLRIPIFLCKAKINDVHLISTLANSHQKVVGLDITVDERLGVNVFDAGY